MSDSSQDILFKCRRSPSLTDWFWMTFYAALITSQTIRCFQLGGLWMAASITIPFVGWALVRIIRKRLQSDLALGRHRLNFIDSQRALEKVYYSSVLKLTEGPAHLRLRHQNERMLFPRSLTLHRHSFAPQDWETLTSLIIERVRKRAPKAELDPLACHFPDPE